MGKNEYGNKLSHPPCHSPPRVQMSIKAFHTEVTQNKQEKSQIKLCSLSHAESAEQLSN